MTWQTGASGNVRRTLALELTQLLDIEIVIRQMVNALGMRRESAIWHLTTVLNVERGKS